jgi:hypothetical protein
MCRNAAASRRLSVFIYSPSGRAVPATSRSNQPNQFAVQRSGGSGTRASLRSLLRVEITESGADSLSPYK